MANSLHVKKGDRVKVIAGKDKGATGEIIAVDPGRPGHRPGRQLVKKHKRETQNNQTRQNNAAGIITTGRRSTPPTCSCWSRWTVRKSSPGSATSAR